MRTLHRVSSVAGAALLGVVLAAGPALADHNPLAPQEGADEHTAMTTGTALLLFVVLPAVLLLVLSAIVWLPGCRAQRPLPPAARLERRAGLVRRPGRPGRRGRDRHRRRRGARGCQR